MTTTNTLVKVKFHGDEIDAIQTPDGRVHVGLRRLCDNFGIAVDTQARKLKGKAWASTTEMMVDCPDGSQRKVTCIDLETLPGWLFTITASKVKPAVRGKLVAYQREAAVVLARHFLQKPDQNQIPAAAMDAVLKLVAQLAARVDELQAKVLAAPAALRCAGAEWAIEMRLAERHPEWPTTRGQRENIRKRANDIIDRKIPGSVREYRHGTLVFTNEKVSHLDTAIDREYRKAAKAGKADGHGLFAGLDEPNPGAHTRPRFDSTADPRKPR